ncbi:MAG TPA: hypothetical protein VEC96_06620 [Anaerolineae bacterium]|nr:hypothetical protein [Anaerolineae bacterium]
MRKKSIFTLFFTIGLALLMIGCQSLPGFNIFETSAPDVDAPRSNFVPPRRDIQVGVGQLLPIESYHVGSTKLMTVEIAINGQPLRAEATAGQPNTFPERLAIAQVLVVGQPAQAAYQQLPFPAPVCRNELHDGPMQTNVLLLTPPSSAQTVCHIWIGRIPGTYNLSLIAVDEMGHRGAPITQTIEVR